MYLEAVVDMVHGLGGLVPEGDQGVLVHNQRVGEHIAPNKERWIKIREREKMIVLKISEYSLEYAPKMSSV